MVKEKVSKKSSSQAQKSLAHGVGRRKKAVARAWLKRGKGSIRINGLDIAQYFDTKLSKEAAEQPFHICKITQYDAVINVKGGGKEGQADAVKLAIARAFVSQDENLRSTLRKHGLLTVDARVKERKKYGQRGARRKFQFVKR